MLVDLTCEYCDIPLEGADPLGEYYVHKGMYRSAVALTDRKSTVHGTLVDALTKYPSYGLVITGHSLGGGVAALLAILLATPSATFMRDRPADHQDHSDISTPFVTSLASGLPPGRPIHCYAYGPPAVASLDLAKYAQGLISSVVHGTDIVPCLSLGCLRDLRNVAVTLSEEGHLAEEIVARVRVALAVAMWWNARQADGYSGGRFVSWQIAKEFGSTLAAKCFAAWIRARRSRPSGLDDLFDQDNASGYGQ